MIATWPFLFVVPGWVLVARVAPDLPAPGRLGIAIVSSVYLSAHLVDLIGRINGFGLAPVLWSVAILAVLTVIMARVRHPWLAPFARPTLAGTRAALRQDRGAWIAATTVALTVLAILGVNGWRHTADGYVSGGWNWSDLLVHVAIGSSIMHGNFPPEVPYFAGAPLIYHWFADFHGAIAATAAGLDVIPVFFLTSSLFAGALALLVWSVALQLTGERRVATIAVILVCFGGGMGWLRLVGDLMTGGSSVIDLVSRNPYDNTWADDWPRFRIASILSTGFLPHRATTLGLPGLVAVVLLVVTCLGRRPAGVLLAGILAALLAPFDFYAAPATYLIVLLYVVASGAWRSPTIVRDGVLFLSPIPLAIPFAAPAVIRQESGGAMRFVLGWGEAHFKDGPVAVAFFYVTNLGLPFILAAIAAVAARGLPARRLLSAWVGALFLVPNLVVLSAVEFRMNEFFQVMWIAVAILAAWLVRGWPRMALAAVLLASAISPALIGLWHLSNPAQTLTNPQEAAARWIERSTPERAVFVTDAFINSPVDLAGRLRISTFGPYVSNLGYDPDARARDTRAVYCDGPLEAARRMLTYRAAYVLSSGGLLECGHEPTDFRRSALFETVYDENGVTVWRLRGP